MTEFSLYSQVQHLITVTAITKGITAGTSEDLVSHMKHTQEEFESI